MGLVCFSLIMVKSQFASLKDYFRIMTDWIFPPQANPFANVDENEDFEAYQRQVEDKKLQEQGECFVLYVSKYDFQICISKVR